MATMGNTPALSEETPLLTSRVLQAAAMVRGMLILYLVVASMIGWLVYSRLPRLPSMEQGKKSQRGCYILLGLCLVVLIITGFWALGMFGQLHHWLDVLMLTFITVVTMGLAIGIITTVRRKPGTARSIAFALAIISGVAALLAIGDLLIGIFINKIL